jgi:peptidoglycan/xylan/chitin deacetylase (PgdA/CDA1 family)
MLYAGVAWAASGYEVAVLGDDGLQVTPLVRFGAGQAGDITGYLCGIDRPPRQCLVTVVESTNGVLDGRMLIAGLAVYRADPWVLPERPAFGSVPARALADAARRDLRALARLEVRGGSLTGRQDEFNTGLDRSAARLDALTAAGRCISYGRREQPGIALTFDDGPNPPYTGRILDILDRYRVPATFFCVGLHAGAHGGAIARMAAAGHGLGNHTWSHPFLPDLSRDQLAEQISRTDEAVARAAGSYLPGLFRPPYGSRTPDVLDWLGERDSTIVLWDVDPSDWAMPGSDVIARRVLEQAGPGAIVLMHDGGGDRSQTVAALPVVIEGLLARGFQFVLVDDLLAPAP